MESGYLYHYTSLEALALILENKTIRFNRLDKVDDKKEAHSDVLNNLCRKVFVSCWTKENEENPALWHMYTPDSRGIRIKVDENLFSIESYKETGLFKETKNGYRVIGTGIKTHISDIELVAIEYGETRIVKPKRVIEQDMDWLQYSEKLLGRIKSKHWEFQKEYRFIINHLFKEEVEEIYIGLNTDVLDGVEIVCGPKMSDGEKIILESLLQKYCNQYSIKESCLNIRDRN